MNNRHVASDVLHDLITSILVAVAAVIASGLLDRVWDAFERAEAPHPWQELRRRRCHELLTCPPDSTGYRRRRSARPIAPS
jgi:hypothetical protein